MSPRMKRIKKLVDLRERHVDAAHAEKIRAEKEAALAARRAEEASDSWRAQAAALANEQAISMADYAAASAHLRALDATAKAAEQQHAQQVAEVAERRAKLVAARRELEKTERWSENVDGRERAERARAERRAEDEVAARTAGGRHAGE